jgi:type III secretory pathway component EscT
VPPGELASELLRALAAAGLDPTSWALAWARLIPSLLLIPTFGLSAFPIALRLGFALVLGATIAPGLVLSSSAAPSFSVAFAAELASGVPVALGVAISVWGATMVGELIDTLRGAARRSPFEGSASPLGVLLSLGAGVAFFQLGGPARLAAALANAKPFHEQDLRSIALALAHGIQFAVVLAGPVLALVPFLELLHGLLGRTSRPLVLSAVLRPVRALLLLAVIALLLDRVANGLVLWLDRTLPP